MLQGIAKIRKALLGRVKALDEVDGLNVEREKNRLLAERAAMTGGKGFRQFPKPARTYPDGTTRGERKRAARERANAKVSEHRAPEFRNQRSMRWQA